MTKRQCRALSHILDLAEGLLGEDTTADVETLIVDLMSEQDRAIWLEYVEED